jgi:hypothetical protein
MDINAPIHLHHNEIHLVAGISFEIISMSFSNDKKYGVAVGSPTDYISPYVYYVLYTTNSGENWNVSNITNILSGLSGKNTNFNVFFQDYSNVVISGGSGYNYRSVDGGMTWNYLNLVVSNDNIPSIFIAENKLKKYHFLKSIFLKLKYLFFHLILLHNGFYLKINVLYLFLMN